MGCRGNGMNSGKDCPCVPLAPTRILFWVLFFKKRFTRPHGNCKSGVRQRLIEDM